MAASIVIQQLLRSPTSIVMTLSVLVFAFLAYRLIYNLYFHPLSRFPGPWYLAFSRLPYCIYLMRGTLTFNILPLHEKYGDIVRIAPDELAISHPDAWADIAGHNKGEELAKYQRFYSVVDSEPKHIANESREEHGRLRRQLANGFSNKGMREQEPLIGKYIDMFIKRLYQNCKEPVDIMAWYNFTTFDVIGDLAFGESFECLENSKYHPWVHRILENARSDIVLQSAAHFPLIKNVILSMIPKSIKEASSEGRKRAQEKLSRRIEKDRPDLIEGLLKKQDELNLSMGKLEANANVLVIAGSETTATLLGGATFLLLSNPDALAKLTQEVRTTFESESDINLSSVSKLKYMLACLDESLRLYPPAPVGLPRVTPSGGSTIIGQHIPGNTVVAVNQWASYHRAKHFKDPYGFHPERFLGDSKFESDQRGVFQPFSVGPRNCIGRNLAYSEMRLILARVVYNFDMRIADESVGWLDQQKIYTFWTKGPLKVHLTPRKAL